jgi:hypothetical protein
MAQYIPLPDGSSLKLREGETAAAGWERAQRMYPEAFGLAAPTQEPQEGIIASGIGGAKRFLSTARTGLEALLAPEEAAKRGLARSEELGQQYAPGASLEAVKKAYAERGFFPAAGEVISQIPTALAEQAPQIAATLGSAKLGAMAGTPLGPVGAVVGGIGGATLPSLLQLFGANIERQAAEGAPEISRGAAAAAAVPGAALEVASTFIPLGKSIVGKLLGPAAEEYFKRGATQATEALAQESLKKVLAKGAAVGAAAEIPTEISQQMLERLQAGLPITTDDALAEYGEAAYGAGLVGAPFGAAGRAAQRSVARDEVAAAEEAKRQEETKKAAEAKAAERAKPEYKAGLVRDREDKIAQIKDLQDIIKQKDQDPDVVKEAKQRIQTLGKEITELGREIRAIDQEAGRIPTLDQTLAERRAERAGQAEVPLFTVEEAAEGRAPFSLYEPVVDREAAQQEEKQALQAEFDEQNRVLTQEIDNLQQQAETTNLEQKTQILQRLRQMEKAQADLAEEASKQGITLRQTPLQLQQKFAELNNIYKRLETPGIDERQKMLLRSEEYKLREQILNDTDALRQAKRQTDRAAKAVTEAQDLFASTGDIESLDSAVNQLREAREKEDQILGAPDLFGDQNIRRIEQQEQSRQELERVANVKSMLPTLYDRLRTFQADEKRKAEQKETAAQEMAGLEQLTQRINTLIDRRGAELLGVPENKRATFDSLVARGALPPELAQQYLGVENIELSTLENAVREIQERRQQRFDNFFENKVAFTTVPEQQQQALATATALQKQIFEKQRIVDAIDAKIDKAAKDAAEEKPVTAVTAKDKEARSAAKKDITALNRKLTSVRKNLGANALLTRDGAAAIKDEVRLQILGSLLARQRAVTGQRRQPKVADFTGYQRPLIDTALLEGQPQELEPIVDARQRDQNLLLTFFSDAIYSLQRGAFTGPRDVEDQYTIEHNRRLQRRLNQIDGEITSTLAQLKGPNTAERTQQIGEIIFKTDKLIGDTQAQLRQPSDLRTSNLLQERLTDLQNRRAYFESKLTDVNQLQKRLTQLKAQRRIVRAGMTENVDQASVSFPELVGEANKTADQFTNEFVSEVEATRNAKGLPSLQDPNALRQFYESLPEGDRPRSMAMPFNAFIREKFNEFIQRASIAKRNQPDVKTEIPGAFDAEGRPLTVRRKDVDTLERPFAKLGAALDVLKEDIENVRAKAKGEKTALEIANESFTVEPFGTIDTAPVTRAGNSRVEKLAASIKNLEQRLEEVPDLSSGLDKPANLALIKKYRDALVDKARAYASLRALSPNELSLLVNYDESSANFVISGPKDLLTGTLSSMLKDTLRRINNYNDIIERLTGPKSEVAVRRRVQKVIAKQKSAIDKIVKEASAARDTLPKTVDVLRGNILEAMRNAMANIADLKERIDGLTAEAVRLRKKARIYTDLEKATRIEMETEPLRAQIKTLEKSLDVLKQQYKKFTDPNTYRAKVSPRTEKLRLYPGISSDLEKAMDNASVLMERMTLAIKAVKLAQPRLVRLDREVNARVNKIRKNPGEAAQRVLEDEIEKLRAEQTNIEESLEEVLAEFADTQNLNTPLDVRRSANKKMAELQKQIDDQADALDTEIASLVTQERTLKNALNDIKDVQFESVAKVFFEGKDLDQVARGDILQSLRQVRKTLTAKRTERDILDKRGEDAPPIVKQMLMRKYPYATNHSKALPKLQIALEKDLKERVRPEFAQIKTAYTDVLNLEKIRQERSDLLADQLEKAIAKIQQRIKAVAANPVLSESQQAVNRQLGIITAPVRNKAGKIIGRTQLPEMFVEQKEKPQEVRVVVEPSDRLKETEEALAELEERLANPKLAAHDRKSLQGKLGDLRKRRYALLMEEDPYRISVEYQEVAEAIRNAQTKNEKDKLRRRATALATLLEKMNMSGVATKQPRIGITFTEQGKPVYPTARVTMVSNVQDAGLPSLTERVNYVYEAVNNPMPNERSLIKRAKDLLQDQIEQAKKELSTAEANNAKTSIRAIKAKILELEKELATIDITFVRSNMTQQEIDALVAEVRITESQYGFVAKPVDAAANVLTKTKKRGRKERTPDVPTQDEITALELGDVNTLFDIKTGVFDPRIGDAPVDLIDVDAAEKRLEEVKRRVEGIPTTTPRKKEGVDLTRRRLVQGIGAGLSIPKMPVSLIKAAEATQITPDAAYKVFSEGQNWIDDLVQNTFTEEILSKLGVKKEKSWDIQAEAIYEAVENALGTETAQWVDSARYTDPEYFQDEVFEKHGNNPEFLQKLKRAYDVAANDIFTKLTANLKPSDKKAEVEQEAPKEGSGIRFNYYRTIADLPQDIKEQIAAQGLDAVANRIKGGVAPDGSVFVVIQNHSNMADLEKTLAHEFIGHYSFESMLGLDGMKSLATRVRKSFGSVQSLAAKLGVADEAAAAFTAGKKAGLSDTDAEVKALKEVIAYTTERQIDKNFLQKAMQFIKELVGQFRARLRELGFLDSSTLSTSDLFYMIKQARQDFEAGKPMAYRASDGTVSFSSAAAAPAAKSGFASMIATRGRFFDKVLSNSIGLAGRVQFLDRLAALDALIKKGVSKGSIDSQKAMDVMYFTRLADQLNNFVTQFATNGVGKIGKNKEGELMYLEGTGRGLLDVSKALAKSSVPPSEAEFEFTSYMAALRAKSVGIDKLDFSGNLTMAQVNAIIDKYKNDPGFKEAREIYQEYNDNLIDFLVSSGAMDAAKAAQLKAEKDYIPYYREVNDGVELIVRGESFFRFGDFKTQPYLRELVGGETKILPIFTSSLQNTRMIVDMALKNMAARNTAFVLNDLGVIDGGIRKMKSAGAGQGPDGTDIIRFKIDGIPHWARVNVEAKKDLFGDEITTELVVRGMEGMKGMVPFGVRLLGMPANWLRRFVTRDPRYAIRQIFRDSMSAVFTTGADFVPVVDTLNQMRGLEKNPTRQSLRASGVIGGQVLSGDDNDIAVILNQVVSGKTGWQTAMAKLDQWAMIGDEATRLSMYNSFVRQGLTQREAIFGTLEAMNFSRRGLSPTMMYANILIPFFNANVQGLDVIYRALKGDMPASEKLRIRSKLFTRGAMMALMTMAYAAMMEDDETYENANPEERYSNWFVPTPLGTFRVPIPFEIGLIFKSIPEGVYRAAATDDTSKEVLSALSKQLLRSVPGDLPTAVKPVVELGLNRSFFTGREIVDASMPDIAKYQYRPNTPEILKLLGEIGISPVQAEYFIKGYTGSLLVGLLRIPDVIVGSAAGTSPSMRITDVPVLGGLFQPPDASGAITRAYDIMKQTQSMVSAYNKLLLENPTEADKFLKENLSSVGYGSAAGSFRQEMGDLTNAERLIRNSTILSPQEKREKLDALRQLKIQTAKVFSKVRAQIERQGVLV